jgi:hypothetical protein
MAAAVVVIVLFLQFKNFETTSRTYATYADAIAAEPVGSAGWLPRWLPSSAYEIEESHNSDTNESWLVFHFSGDSFNRSMCLNLDKAEAPLPDEKLTKRFPKFAQDARKLIEGSTAFTFHRCDDNLVRFLATDERANVAYSWTLAG